MVNVLHLIIQILYAQDILKLIISFVHSSADAYITLPPLNAHNILEIPMFLPLWILLNWATHFYVQLHIQIPL